MLSFWSRLDRSRRPLPTPWQEILERNVPIAGRLPEAARTCFERHLQVFLGGISFEGCNGLDVTEEMKVTVAGYAALLLSGNAKGRYTNLGTVVLYPRSFAAPIRAADHTGVVTETVEERLGESWQEGTVVLAWDSIGEILRGASGDCNVIVHEFAHQIDTQFGITAGAPLLALNDRYPDWQGLLAAEQRSERSARRRGRPVALDPYAFTHPEELFAVASEGFFMRPVRFKASHPELYTELQAIYGLDPAAWRAKSC